MRSLKEKRVWMIYILVEIAIFIVLMYAMVNMDHMVYDRIQFSLVAINFVLMSCFLWCYQKQLSGFRDYAIPFALTATLIADVFTCLIPDAYLVGLIAFCIVQTIYMLYLGVNRYNLLARIVVMVALVLVFKPNTIFLCFGCYSMANLFVNVVTAWYRYTIHRKSGMPSVAVREILLFAIGITCFLGCDTSITVRGFADEQSTIYLVFNLLAWVFYMPSQILINTSRFISYPKRKDS